MARTVTWDELRRLAGFRAANGRAISLYLNLDPSVAPTPGDADTRLNSLLDEAAKAERAGDGGLRHDARQGLRADVERIRTYFDAEFDPAGARGLAVFCDGPDGLWAPMELADAVPDAAHVDRTLHLTPLVRHVGRGDGALAVVASREQGRFFRLRNGRLHEVSDLSDEQPRRHDQGGWSQARFQRRIDNLASEHLREVADELDRRVRRAGGGVEILVVSPEETRAELSGLLSQETQAAVVGWAHAEAHASVAELEELLTRVLDEARATSERQLAERWREEAGRNGRAAAGWDATLTAASDARVDVLLLSDGADREAWRCPSCGRASASAGECPLDGSALEPVAKGADTAVQLTLAHGGTVRVFEHVPDLGPTEGIGALLRF
jgi:peptide chain release factor subunit 1